MKKTLIILLLLALTAVTCSAPCEAAIGRDEAKRVWERVAKPTELTALPFSIKEEKTPNAWVTNGESVTVTTGLLDVLDNSAELFNVFAHEAGHVKLSHAQKGATRTAGLSIAASILSQLLGGDMGGAIGGAAVNIGANLVNSGWSREQEIEADDYAVALAKKENVDPVGMYAAIARLAKINKTEPSGFNSHPPDDRRMQHIKNKILELEPNAKFPEI